MQWNQIKYIDCLDPTESSDVSFKFFEYKAIIMKSEIYEFS